MLPKLTVEKGAIPIVMPKFIALLLASNFRKLALLLLSK
jgi:hypothetical protein